MSMLSGITELNNRAEHATKREDRSYFASMAGDFLHLFVRTDGKRYLDKKARSLFPSSARTFFREARRTADLLIRTTKG